MVQGIHVRINSSSHFIVCGCGSQVESVAMLYLDLIKIHTGDGRLHDQEMLKRGNSQVSIVV
jgi:hypothetical protein